MAKTKITLNKGQAAAMRKLIEFLQSGDECRVFILRGYAGTGKTTLLKYLLDELDNTLHLNYRLLSPTARAAKIMRDITGRDASTIHSMLFTSPNLNKDLDSIDSPQDDTLTAIDRYGQLFLDFAVTHRGDNDDDPVIYIIDEASMVADVEQRIVTQARFGSGRLLMELLSYDTKPGSKYIFIGDPCQLPPVIKDEDTDNQALLSFSPALFDKYFEKVFDTKPTSVTLTEVMRQEKDSGLLEAATNVRRLRLEAPLRSDVYPPNVKRWGRLPLMGYRDIIFHNNYDKMEDIYVNQFKSKGPNSVIFISYSNPRCWEHSRSIRAKLGITGPGIQKGDLLMVSQNNYLYGINNGDMVEVTDVEPQIEGHCYLHYRNATVRNIITNVENKVKIIEDTLYNGSPNLSSEQQTTLLADFHERMKEEGIKQSSPVYMENMRNDRWLNALRVTYGYCVTCHKSQGGEWPMVLLDVRKNLFLNPLRSSYQWLYTALTRATREVHLLYLEYMYCHHNVCDKGNERDYHYYCTPWQPRVPVISL